jgi:metal-sulfur cluster biosynthetic enzyme
MSDESDAINIIKKVKHPMIDKNLIELGIISHVEIKNNTLDILFSFPFPDIPIKDVLINSIKTKLEENNFILNIKTNVMDEEQRKTFLQLESEAWKG